MTNKAEENVEWNDFNHRHPKIATLVVAFIAVVWAIAMIYAGYLIARLL